EATARGAGAAGGEAIGILPWTEPGEANPYCTRVVAAGVGQARNLAVVGAGQVAIAVGGAWGTLSEIGHARAIGRTVVTLRGWQLGGEGAMEDAPGVIAAETPEQAVAVALSSI